MRKKIIRSGTVFGEVMISLTRLSVGLRQIPTHCVSLGHRAFRQAKARAGVANRAPTEELRREGAVAVKVRDDATSRSKVSKMEAFSGRCKYFPHRYRTCRLNIHIPYQLQPDKWTREAIGKPLLFLGTP